MIVYTVFSLPYPGRLVRASQYIVIRDIWYRYNWFVYMHTIMHAYTGRVF